MKNCIAVIIIIKNIICNQNMIELPDETISKQVRDSLEEARKYKQRLHNSKVYL